MSTAVTKESKEKLVKITLPKLRNGNKEQVYISINDRVWMAKRGVEVELPDYVVDAIRDNEKAAEASDAYIESKVNG